MRLHEFRLETLHRVRPCRTSLSIVLRAHRSNFFELRRHFVPTVLYITLFSLPWCRKMLSLARNLRWRAWQLRLCCAHSLGSQAQLRRRATRLCGVRCMFRQKSNEGTLIKPHRHAPSCSRAPTEHIQFDGISLGSTTKYINNRLP